MKPINLLGNTFDSEIRNAFYEAWAPHVNKHGKLASTAASVYERAHSNTFMDNDTECLVRFLEQTLPNMETDSISTRSESLIAKYKKWLEWKTNGTAPNK